MLSLFEFLAMFTALVVLVIASWIDFRTREVPDYLSYCFIGVAILLRLIWAVAEWDIVVLQWVPVSFGLLFVFSYLMYKSGQWGGGDVKIMMGISILLSSFSGEMFPFFFNFWINSLPVGAVYGLAFLAIIGFNCRKKLKLKWFDGVGFIVLMLVVGALFVYLKPTLAFMISLIAGSIWAMKYIKLIEKKCMQAYVKVENLTEGDWLVNQVKVGKVVIKKRKIGLIASDLKLLNQLKNKGQLSKVLVKIGVPFVPAFLLTLIVTYFFGNILFRIVELGLF